MLFAQAPVFNPRVKPMIKDSSPHQIAEELGLSLHTVREHIQDVYRKTGAHSLRQLLRMLVGDVDGESGQ